MKRFTVMGLGDIFLGVVNNIPEDTSNKLTRWQEVCTTVTFYETRELQKIPQHTHTEASCAQSQSQKQKKLLLLGIKQMDDSWHKIYTWLNFDVFTIQLKSNNCDSMNFSFGNILSKYIPRLFQEAMISYIFHSKGR